MTVDRSAAGPYPRGGSAGVLAGRGADIFGKVAVLMGGSSAEREISVMSGSGVLEIGRASWRERV